MLLKHQAITRSNVDQVLCTLMASPGTNELTDAFEMKA